MPDSERAHLQRKIRRILDEPGGEKDTSTLRSDPYEVAALADRITAMLRGRALRSVPANGPHGPSGADVDRRGR
jgi:hypothetical protein